MLCFGSDGWLFSFTFANLWPGTIRFFLTLRRSTIDLVLDILPLVVVFYCFRPFLSTDAACITVYTLSSSPWRSSAVIVTSCILAAVVSIGWIRPLYLSIPICALYPKYHVFAFFVACASESRRFSEFSVELGADMIVESTMVLFWE